MVIMNKSVRPLGALLASSALLLAAGCSGGAAGPGATGQPGQLDVVAAFYPFQFLAERVAGPHASVTSLTTPGAEPHDLELTPRQVASISTADLIVYEHSFQTAVDEAVEQSGNQHVLDAAAVVPLQPLTSGGHEEHAGEKDDHGGLDPHVWLDPTQMVTLAGAVRDQLSDLDPEHAADYQRNAAALEAELTTLDQDFRSGLARCEREEFVTTHTAFGYLAKRYGLSQIGITGLSPEAEPSPARIAEVQREAGEHGVTTIFYETLVSPAIAEAIAGDLGLATDVLDPIEGITDASRGQDYVAVMHANLAALVKAGGCS